VVHSRNNSTGTRYAPQGRRLIVFVLGGITRSEAGPAHSFPHCSLIEP
jgi:hypothetical protein